MGWQDTQLRIFLGITALRIIVFQGYHSTDFEVHRNWLAITYSKPISEWYTESTSEWTLDYPPLFAWFEWLLAQAAQFVDPHMLDVTNLYHDSQATVIFQRVTVMVSELVLVAAVWKACRLMPLSGDRKVVAAILTFFLVVGNAGLMMVDHIHFQYNGFLIGILLWSALLIQQGHDFWGGVLFAVLLNMKHLFAYLGPVYFIYLLRHYCVGSRAVAKFVKLGLGVIVVFAISFGPFVALGQTKQVLSRLFPFGRGLIHSYWAANFWALYAFGDKVLTAVAPKMGLDVESSTGNLAGGVVGVSHFTVLPQISPKVTFIMVLLAMVPCLASLARRPRPGQFTSAIAYAALCGFMFGYHVHEKAILPALIPLGLDVATSARIARYFILLSSAGHYALFPLLYQPEEYGFKLFYTLFYTFLLYKGVQWMQTARTVYGVTLTSSLSSRPSPAQAASVASPLHVLDWLYMAGFVLLELFNSLLHPLWFGETLPFLPLMLTSVYCAVGVMWIWAEMFVFYVREAVEAGKIE